MTYTFSGRLWNNLQNQINYQGVNYSYNAITNKVKQVITLRKLINSNAINITTIVN